MSKKAIKIGIFDSGLGGLTVLKELEAELPSADFLYFGDTARIPYGPKSPSVVIQFSMEIARFLFEKNCDFIVIACNTASACALDTLRSGLRIPIEGVVAPGARAAIAATNNGKIGLLATATTVHSGAYQNYLRSMNPQIEVTAIPAPLLVPLVEEGWLEDDITKQILLRYLQPLFEAEIDTLILGCTHYPLLEPVIASLMREQRRSFQIVNSAKATACEVAKKIKDSFHLESSFLNTQFVLTDARGAFQSVGKSFLGREIFPVHSLSLQELQDSSKKGSIS